MGGMVVVRTCVLVCFFPIRTVIEPYLNSFVTFFYIVYMHACKICIKSLISMS